MKYLWRVTACYDLVQCDTKGPNVRGKGKFTLLQALNGIPVHYKVIKKNRVQWPKSWNFKVIKVKALSNDVQRSMMYQQTGLSPCSWTRQQISPSGMYFVRPKSPIFTSLSFSTKTLRAARSRWTNRFVCKQSMPFERKQQKRKWIKLLIQGKMWNYCSQVRTFRSVSQKFNMLFQSCKQHLVHYD